MNKGKNGTLSSAKGKRAANVDDYFAHVPEPGHSALKKVRAAIQSAAPAGATEVISYGIPAFKHDGVLVWYAAFARHCSLFPGGGILGIFEDEIKGYKTSKGTIQFALNRPLPVALIKRIVKERFAQANQLGKSR